MPVEIRTRTSPPSRGVPTQIDALFVSSKVAAGSDRAEAASVRTMDDYAALGVARSDNPITYDGLENFFREGGRRAVVGTYTADIADSWDKFTPEFGGGQLTAWDEGKTGTVWADLHAAAQDQMRYALYDVDPGDDSAQELQLAADTLPTFSEFGAGFGPWVTIGPLPDVSGGGNRQVPASSTVAGLITRSDALGNPNRAPAGRDFPLQNAISVGIFTDAEATALRQAGLNPLRLRLGMRTLDGFRTSDDKNPELSPFWQANAGRARMWLQWNGLAIGLNYEYKTIDGRGRVLDGLQSDLEAMCKTLWEADGLFGETSREAYAVSTAVTLDDIATGTIRATVQARLSMHAELVIIELVSVPVNGAVA